jgi:hypothetical protein
MGIVKGRDPFGSFGSDGEDGGDGGVKVSLNGKGGGGASTSGFASTLTTNVVMPRSPSVGKEHEMEGVSATRDKDEEKERKEKEREEKREKERGKEGEEGTIQVTILEEEINRSKRW